jgi:hypothetical protein
MDINFEKMASWHQRSPQNICIYSVDTLSGLVNRAQFHFNASLKTLLIEKQPLLLASQLLHTLVLMTVCNDSGKSVWFTDYIVL